VKEYYVYNVTNSTHTVLYY